MKRPALFLDRDGVVNVDHAYVYQPENFEFVDGVFELVCAANKAGYLVVVVTNQAGIGRGYYTEADFHFLTEWMLEQFSVRSARIDAVYFSPYHPEYGVGQYRRESDCRKPGAGMLLQAAKDYEIDLNASLMVGDKITDMQAGKRAGVGSLLYFGNETDNLLGKRIFHLTEIVALLSRS